MVTEAVPWAASVTAGFWVGTGSRDEAPHEYGASHFLEHLLFKGTDALDASEVARMIDRVGGDMNAFTTKEYTAFYVRMLGEDSRMGIELLCDLVARPALRSADFESERQVILEEILMHADEPGDMVQELASEAVFGDHGLGREVLGSAESIAAMALSQVESFFRYHYRPSNMVFAAAGDLVHEQVLEMVGERLEGLSGGARPSRETPAAALSPFTLCSRPTEQAHLVLATSAPDRHDSRRWAFELLEQLLGGGVSSRLFQEVRERRGLAYSVYADSTLYDDAGMLSVYAGTAPGKAAEVVRVIEEQLVALAGAGCTTDEVELAKGHFRSSMLMAMEESGSRMSWIGRNQLLLGRQLGIDEVLEKVAAVSVDDVSGLASELLSQDMALAVVGPFGGDDLVPVGEDL